MTGTKKITVFDVALLIVMLLVCFVTLYPFWYCLIYSFSDTQALLRSRSYWLPSGFSLENYNVVFRNPLIMPAFFVSVARTVVGTIYPCFVTGIAAFALTKSDMPGRKFFMYFLLIPMYIGGGLIASYVNIVRLGLYNNVLVYVLPAGFSTYYLLVMRTHFLAIPPSLEESAKLDGASYFRIFGSIIVPLSMPIFATCALFAGVGQWNSWFDAMIYITDASKHPLQNVLQNMLRQSSNASMNLIRQARTAMGGRQINVTPESIQMATLIITTVPIVVVYPFLQKHFIKGVMIGAVKA